MGVFDRPTASQRSILFAQGFASVENPFFSRFARPEMGWDGKAPVGLNLRGGSRWSHCNNRRA
jgi:hypothetical protein